uniref:G-protein coupled receptors family 1 profile domain-containing protein n=1 Tax=Gallus gallus TaxID=9031 RepID=A0A8V0XK43_CHICK
RTTNTFPHLPLAMLVFAVHALTFAVGFPANVFTFLTLLIKIWCHRPHSHLTAADLLLLNLITADLLVLLFLPFKMAEEAAMMVWPFPTALCPIANFCSFSSIYLSTLFMAALSVEHYFGVVFPHRYNRRRRLWRTMAASAILWVMALSHCSIIFVAEYHREFGINGSTQPSLGYHCYNVFSQAQLHFVLPLRLSLFLILFLIPFAITMFCYIGLIRALLTRPQIPLQKKYRTVGLAVVTMVNFGVCFGPFNLSHVVGFVQQRSPEWRPYALLLTTLSAALDPFIFYFSSTAVRRAVSGMVGAIRDTMCGFWGCVSLSHGVGVSMETW